MRLPRLYWPIIPTVLLICWTLLISPHTKYGDNWALVPVLLAFISVIAIHVWIMITRGRSVGIVLYSVLDVFVTSGVCLWALTLITKDSL